MHEYSVRLKANDDGTWDIIADDGVGTPLATLTIEGGPNDYLSIDVRPATPSTMQAIAYGSTGTLARTDRVSIDTRETNGQLREGSTPFVCVDISPFLTDGGQS